MFDNAQVPFGNMISATADVDGNAGLFTNLNLRYTGISIIGNEQYDDYECSGVIGLPANSAGNSYGYSFVSFVTYTDVNNNMVTDEYRIMGTVTVAARMVSVSGNVSPSSLTAAGGTLDVAATVNDSAGLYNDTASVLAFIYEDGTEVTSQYMTEGTGSNDNQFSYSYPIPENADGRSHTYTVKLQAMDGSVMTSMVSASGSCVETGRTVSVSGSVRPEPAGQRRNSDGDGDRHGLERLV